MRSLRAKTSVTVALLLASTLVVRAQMWDPRTSVTDSAAAAFRAAIGQLTSPEFEQRKARRLELQRRGYADILHRSVARDVWGALLALLKLKAQLDFHLPSNTLMINVCAQRLPSRRDPAGVFMSPYERYEQYPLIEDRRFPKDPWRK
jgi:hypothetical protein